MKKLTSMLLALCLMLAMCAVATAEVSIFAGGTGTEDDPFEIATAEQLLALSTTVNDGSAQGYPGQFFVLTEDIDLAGVEWQPIGHMDLEDMSNNSCMFFGTFDGQGHTISNVTFNSDYPVCGVGVVGMNLGEVKNLTVENVQIRCEDTYSMAIGGSFGGTMDNCTAKGTVIAEGNEPVGMGGIAGCLEMMDRVANCTAEVEIISEKGGHAIGGLCGFSGTHSNGNIVAEAEGIVTTEYPGIIDNCAVTVKMNVPGATHVGGLVGTGLYYYGEETAFKVSNCTVNAEIIGAVTPGAVAGRAVNSVIESCDAQVTLDGESLTSEIGETETMYESGDQFEEKTPTEDEVQDDAA